MECDRLYVNRRKFFNDKKEHYLTFKWPGFLMPVGENIPSQPNKTAYWRSFREEFSKWANMPTVCWTLSNQESYLMWKGYTDDIGVCIVSSIRRFISSICDGKDFKKEKYTVHCGQMIYNSYSSLEIDSLPFWKGREYASENELRFYFENPEDKQENGHIYIPIDKNALIERVILTPFIHSMTSKALADMIHDKYGINVSLSKINTK